MVHLIEQVFGEGCNLYEVLSVPADADKAALRKSYYRAALKYHPDRNPGNEQAHHQFQAISVAYQILSDADARAEYDETGVIPDFDEEAKEASENGVDQWKEYFDKIFGRVTSSEIDAFASKYKCSDEEKRDVLKEFRKQKGDLVKMLDFVLLSEPRDAQRWVEDFIVPAMEAGELEETFRPKMDKSLETCKRKAEKENNKEAMDEGGDDEDTETESEHSEAEEETRKKPGVKSTKSPKKTPTKARPTQAKKKAKKNDMGDLVAAIQNKNRGGGSVFASLGARYGVSMDDEDPLNDADFEKIQSKLKNDKARRKK